MLQLESADRDIEARLVLWKAICIASESVRHRFSVRSICAIDGTEISSGMEVPNIATWRLIEALSLINVILCSQDVEAGVINVFRKTGPIKIQEDGIAHYLWAQQTMQGERSALSGRPDLIVTTSQEQPSSQNAVRIIEAKSLKQLDTGTVRSEFGKAYDLRVASYLIWSFYSPTPRVIEGARGLGINVELLGFDTARRADLVKKPEVLVSHMSKVQEQARRDKKFALALEEASQAAGRKQLGPSK